MRLRDFIEVKTIFLYERYNIWMLLTDIHTFRVKPTERNFMSMSRVFSVTYFTFNWISVELPDGRSLFIYYRALVRAVCVIKCDGSINNIEYL
jgi:hypothetical protein